jgi:hypothetical protein
MKQHFALLLLGLGLLAGCNPFAPGLDEMETDQEKLLGDRATINGFYDWFRNSYQLRDSTLYGQLLTPDFQFTYKDFSNNTETSWDRGVDMQTTYNLFRSVRSITLQWNQYLQLDTISSDTLALTERSFNLRIVQDDNNVYSGVGSARLVLRRRYKGDKWKMVSWYDTSDF